MNGDPASSSTGRAASLSPVRPSCEPAAPATGAARPWDPLGYPRDVLRRHIESTVGGLGLEPGSRVLDFGCGVRPYRDAFPDDVEYLGADLPENESADLAIVDGTVDLADASVELVISTQVLEHVPDPQAYLAECRRVLRSGGWLVLTTHGVMFHHPHPTDFWRWTTEGLQRVVTQAGLTVRSVTPVMGAVPLGLWLVMMNLQHRLPVGVRHAFVAALNVLIRWSDRYSWQTYRADFVYLVLAQVDPASLPDKT